MTGMTTTNKPFAIGNKLLMVQERRDITRAAYFAFAGRHADAERIRERLGYDAAQLVHDVDKVKR